MAWPARLAALLAHPRFGWVAALVAVVVSLPALGVGLQLDDHLHRFSVGLHAEGNGLAGWWELYVAAEGDPELTRARMAKGFAPWWTVPQLRLRFFRPLTAATHYLEYAAWPDLPWLMHAQSLAWYAALVVAVGALMRRWLGPTGGAGLATLLFAIDDAHATPIGWIAQRNALLSGLLVVLMLWAHDRARRDGWAPGRWLGPLLLLLGLLAGEAAVGALGYLGAQAMWLEPPRADGEAWWRRSRRGLLALWPYAVVLVGWRLAYDAMGYGAHGSGVYLDPVREPAAFLALLPDRAAALALAQLGPFEIDRFGLVPPPWTAARWGALGLGLALVLALAPRLRARPGVAVALVGSALALVPAATVVPMARMLLLAGVGASAALAEVIVAALDPSRRWRWRALPVALALPILWVHAVRAPAAMPGKLSALPSRLEGLQPGGIETLPDDAALTEQDLVVVNAPPTFGGSYLWLMRWGTEHALPRRLRVLGTTAGPVIVQRPDPHTLVLQPVGGYFGDPFSAIARGSGHAFVPGQRIELPDWSIEIAGVAAGLPTVVRMRLSVPLEHPSLRWVIWREDGFVEFVPPSVGRSMAIPALLPGP